MTPSEAYDIIDRRLRSAANDDEDYAALSNLLECIWNRPRGMTPEEIRQSLKDAEPKVKALQKRLTEAKRRATSRNPIVID